MHGRMEEWVKAGFVVFGLALMRWGCICGYYLVYSFFPSLLSEIGISGQLGAIENGIK